MRGSLAVLRRAAIPSALVLLGVAMPASSPDVARQARTTLPNIIVIVADDLGWNDVGYHGSRIRTPRLDRLAREGVRLNRHYAYPSCSPTRAALLTGRNPARFNVFAPLGADHGIPPADMRLPWSLRASGYTTHIVGKWHLGETPQHRPLRFGFTTSYGYLRGQIDPYTHRYKTGDHQTWHRNDRFVEEAGHVTTLITDEAIRIVETAADGTPFFLYVAHHAPHHPLNEPPAWIEPYESVFTEPSRRHYAASVTHLDHEVGRLVDALDRVGARRNTLVVFFSDNGGQNGWPAPASEYNGRYAPLKVLGDNRPLRGWKTQLYEGGIRVPAFVNWPGVLDAGRQVDVPVHVLDWAPTLIRVGGGAPADEWRLEGRDLRPLLRGQSTEWGPRRFYWNNANAQWAVRDGDWKLIADRTGKVELFNVVSDPHETENLARAEPDRVRRMQQSLREERARDGEASHVSRGHDY